MSRLDRLVARLLALLLGAAVANVAWQVISRFVLGSPSSVTDELARYLLVWVGLLGAAHAVGQRRHLAIELLPQRLGAGARRRLLLATHAVVALFAGGVLVVGGIRLVWLTATLGQRSAALGLPLAVVYAVVPLSGLLVLVHLAAQASRSLRGEEQAPLG